MTTFYTTAVVTSAKHVVFMVRELPFLNLGADVRFTPEQAINVANALVTAAASIDPELEAPETRYRILVSRKPFEPFYRFTCPACPDAGQGLYQDVAPAGDAARKHYATEHTQETSR